MLYNKKYSRGRGVSGYAREASNGTQEKLQTARKRSFKRYVREAAATVK